MGNAIIVLTHESPSEMFQKGGSGHWVAQRGRAAQCEYLIALHNVHGKEGVPGQRGTAFLIGRISGVEPSFEYPKRVVIKFSEWAPIHVPHTGQRFRNPVFYGDTADYLAAVDFDALSWEPFPVELIEAPPVKPLTFAEAKAGLAVWLNVEPGAIEISVKA